MVLQTKVTPNRLRESNLGPSFCSSIYFRNTQGREETPHCGEGGEGAPLPVLWKIREKAQTGGQRTEGWQVGRGHNGVIWE